MKLSLKTKSALTYVVVGLLLVAVVVAVVLFSRGGEAATPKVLLPSAAATQTPGASATEPPQDAGVTPETVQAVIAAMARQDSYMRTLSVTNRWAGGSKTETVTVWVSGENTRILLTGPDGEQKHILILGDELWVWYGDGGEVYHGTAAGEGYYDADSFQGIISYEDVLALEAGDILAAAYTDYLNEPCVYVEYVSGELGYTTKAYISVSSGLLTGAEVYDGDTLVYSMESLSFESSVSAGDAFEPPES